MRYTTDNPDTAVPLRIDASEGEYATIEAHCDGQWIGIAVLRTDGVLEPSPIAQHAAKKLEQAGFQTCFFPDPTSGFAVRRKRIEVHCHETRLISTRDFAR